MRGKNLQAASIALVLLMALLTSCNDSSLSSASMNGVSGPPFRIKGSFPKCTMDSISLYTADGLDMKKLHAVAIQKKGSSYTFDMQGNVPQEGFYFLGEAPNNLRPVILGNEKGLELEGNCINLRGYSKISNSQVNKAFDMANGKMRQLQQQVQTYARQANNPATAPAARAKVKELIDLQISIKDSLLENQPFVGKVAALQIFKPFDPGDNPEGFRDPFQHFGDTFLSHADLSDEAYNKAFPLSEQIQSFVQTLFSAGIDQAAAEAMLDKLLARIPQGSEAQKNSLAIALTVMEQLNNIGFVKYSQQYMGAFEVSERMQSNIQNRIQFISLAEKQRLEDEKLLGVGAIPPEINLPTPAGKNKKLSSLRGKVVLLDFWASWCGPCRRENPNVVRAYNKYKDKGFTVFSVSLDRSRPPWLQAIEKDNMTWHHVSDLKYFNSVAARDYKINAIPATFLLDREGKIIGKNLRGPALEAKLQTIFN